MSKLNFVKRANKDNPVAKKGEPYYWWRHYRGPIQYSKERPRQSRLESNEDLAEVYSILEEIEDCKLEELNDEAANAERDAWVDRLRDVASNVEDKLSNIPEHLHDGDTGQLLQDRIEAINNVADEIETCDVESYDSLQEWKDAIVDAGGTFSG